VRLHQAKNLKLTQYRAAKVNEGPKNHSMWRVGSPVAVVPEFRRSENPTFSTESADSFLWIMG
jgi:hypothetical protein